MANAAPVIDLLFHDDWELNGDGSGCMTKLMLDPARRLLEICERYGARYTFFAEVGQQLAMRSSSIPEHRELARRWEDAMVDAIRRGHDVQLHLHPQWLGASFDGSRWRLVPDRWNTGRLGYHELMPLLRDGKRYLEALLRPHRPDYRVCAFRAGGWMCQPSGTLSRVLRELDITADVTVVKGRHKVFAVNGVVDFRDAPSSFSPWRADENDFAREAAEGDGVLVIPTYSELIHLPLPLHLFIENPFSLVHYLSVLRRWREHQESYEDSPPCRANGDGMVRHQRGLGKLFRPRSIYASFNYMHHSTLTGMVRRLHGILKKRELSYAPMIMLAHSKSFYSYANFESLLARLRRLDFVRFATTQEVVSRCDALLPRRSRSPSTAARPLAARVAGQPVA